MEDNEKNIKNLCNYLVVNYLQTNGYEIAKDALLREIDPVPEELSMKTVSEKLGYKDQIKLKVVDTREFNSVLEALCDQLVGGVTQEKEVNSKKVKGKKKKSTNNDNTPTANDANEDKYDWGGEKIETVKEVEEINYHFGGKKKHAQTPFELLNKNKIKSEPVQLSDKKKKQKKVVDELEQQLEDLF